MKIYGCPASAYALYLKVKSKTGRISSSVVNQPHENDTPSFYGLVWFFCFFLVFMWFQFFSQEGVRAGV
jgi:hypothetical protein